MDGNTLFLFCPVPIPVPRYTHPRTHSPTPMHGYHSSACRKKTHAFLPQLKAFTYLETFLGHSSLQAKRLIWTWRENVLGMLGASDVDLGRGPRRGFQKLPV